MSTIDHDPAAVKPAPTFLQKLAALADWLGGDPDPDLAGLGDHLADLAAEARALDAGSWEQFADRKAAIGADRV